MIAQSVTENGIVRYLIHLVLWLLMVGSAGYLTMGISTFVESTHEGNPRDFGHKKSQKSTLSDIKQKVIPKTKYQIVSEGAIFDVPDRIRITKPQEQKVIVNQKITSTPSPKRSIRIYREDDTDQEMEREPGIGTYFGTVNSDDDVIAIVSLGSEDETQLLRVGDRVSSGIVKYITQEYVEIELTGK